MKTSNGKNYQNKYIFEYLRNILTSKSEKIYEEHVGDSENFKSFPSVVIFRYLSMCRDERVRRLILNNQILLERLDKMGHEYVYMYLLKNVPKQSDSFIKYIK